jgi:hypothetical protein
MTRNFRVTSITFFNGFVKNQRVSNLGSGGSTVVKHLPNNPKVVGSKPAAADCPRREKMGTKSS